MANILQPQGTQCALWLFLFMRDMHTYSNSNTAKEQHINNYIANLVTFKCNMNCVIIKNDSRGYRGIRTRVRGGIEISKYRCNINEIPVSCLMVN